MLTLFVALSWPLPIVCGVTVALPHTTHTAQALESIQDDALDIAVMRDGQAFLDTTSVTPDELQQKLQERIRNGAPLTAYIRADARVRYKAVTSVLDTVRSAGLSNVVFLTSPKP